MKCPVCKTELSINMTKCPVCEFDEVTKEFINTVDAVDWVENVVAPYKRKWETSVNYDDATSLYNSLIATQMSDCKTKAFEFSDIEYVVENDEIVITKYISAKSKYAIPTTVNGLPVSRIADQAFYGCKELEKIIIPQTVTHIGKEAFMGAGIKEIVFPKSVPYISEGVCRNCGKLTTVVILGAEVVGENAFHNCRQLTKIAFADTLKQIANCSFFGCTSLKTVHIPASVENISEGAFAIEGARQDPHNYKKWYVAEWIWNDDTVYETEDEVRKFYFLGNITNFISYNAPHFKMCSEKCIFYCNPGSDAQAYARTHNITVKPIKG